MYSFLSDFPFNGARDYVHGPTLFEIFRDRVLELMGGDEATPFRFAYFRVNQPIQENGRVTIFDASETEARKKAGRPLAELSCHAGGQEFYVGCYADQPSPVAHRRDSLEKTFVGPVAIESPLNGTAEIKGARDNNDLFQAVVEANKQIHLVTVTGDPWSTKIRFRFAYCLNYSCPILGAGSHDGRVAVRSLGTRVVGDHFFSLTQLDLDIAGVRDTFKLCFASKDLTDYVP